MARGYSLPDIRIPEVSEVSGIFLGILTLQAIYYHSDNPANYTSSLIPVSVLSMPIATFVPRPFLRTREEFEIRGRRKARERVWQIEWATVGMLERLEWNAVSVLCIRPTVLYSVARTANPGEGP